MSKTTKKTTAIQMRIKCDNTACKFRGLTGFCFAKPGDTCPDGKIEQAKDEKPTPVPGFPMVIKDKNTAIQAIAATHAAIEHANKDQMKVGKLRTVKQEQVKKSPYIDHIAEWTDDTERNLHTEVRIKIAAWCCDNATAEADEFALLLSDLQYILAESTNCITPELQDFRHELDAELIERIGRVFGEKAATEIHGCL